VLEFQEQADHLVKSNKNIFMLLNRLGQEDDESIIQDIVKEIRDKLKKINQNDVYDFYSYVEVVDRKIEATFSQKMKVVIQKFV